MESDIYIRVASQSDAEGISGVICDAIKTINSKDYSVDAIKRLMQNFSASNVSNLMKGRTTFVAVVNVHIIGTAALQQSEVKSVFVLPELHRKGVGKFLLNAVEDAAKKQGLAELSVSSSIAAVNFYSALGYMEKARQFYGDEETVVMSKTEF